MSLWRPALQLESPSMNYGGVILHWAASARDRRQNRGKVVILRDF